MILAGVLAVLAGALAALDPAAALCAVAIVLPFDAPAAVKAPVTVFTCEALVAGLLAGILIRRIRERDSVARPAVGALGWLAVLAVAAALSAVHAVDHWAVVKQALRWAQLWLVFAVVAQYARGTAGARLGACYAGMAVVLAVLGSVEVYAGPGSALNMPGWVLDENPAVERAHGPFHPNAFAPYLAVAILLVVARWRALAARMTGWLLGAGVALLATALVLTQSRTGWVAAGTAIAVWAAVRSRRPLRLLLPVLVLLAVAGLAAALAPPIRARVLSIASPWQAPSFQFRLRAFRIGLDMWAEHPLTGVGAGNYGPAFERMRARIPPDMHPALRAHVHDFFLQTGLETGILGLAAWLGALGWLAAWFWRARARAREGAALGLGLLALFVAGNTLEITTMHARGIMFAIGWGIAAAMIPSVPARGLARRGNRVLS